MMASYVVEGLMDAVLSDTDPVLWLREHVELVVIPFVDKDGVEAGDQGKNRIPHDHKADYHGESIYPEVAALRAFVSDWAHGKPHVTLDMHDPTMNGDVIYTHALRVESDTGSGDNAHAESRAQARTFLSTLEQVQRGSLKFRVQDSIDFAARMAAAKGETAPAGLQSADTEKPSRKSGRTPITIGFEIPYAMVRGVEVNPASARAFGRDIAVALSVYLQHSLEPVNP